MYHQVDPEDVSSFRNKRVLVVGRGNSAFEVAEHIQGHTAYVHLAGSKRGQVRLAWETHYVGDVRAVHTHMLDSYMLKSLDAVLEINFEVRPSCRMMRAWWCRLCAGVQQLDVSSRGWHSHHMLLCGCGRQHEGCHVILFLRSSYIRKCVWTRMRKASCGFAFKKMAPHAKDPTRSGVSRNVAGSAAWHYC